MRTWAATCLQHAFRVQLTCVRRRPRRLLFAVDAENIEGCITLVRASAQFAQLRKAGAKVRTPSRKYALPSLKYWNWDVVLGLPR